jgi:hypothetical protein
LLVCVFFVKIKRKLARSNKRIDEHSKKKQKNEKALGWNILVGCFGDVGLYFSAPFLGFKKQRK